MKRVIKAAVAVAAFGLAAAICSPAQAEAVADDTFSEHAAAGTVSMALQGLSGGLFDSGAALSGLGSGQSTMAADGVYATGSETIGRLLGVSADQVTWGTPARGISDGTGPVGQTVDTTGGLLGNTADAAASVGRLVEGTQNAGEAVEGVGDQGGAVDGLVHGLNQAVPQGPEQPGSVSPLVSAVTSTEAAPVAEAVEPVTRSASVDELAPLLGDTGGQGARTATRLVDSMGEAVSEAARRAAE
ncbi:hypothetical protein HS041_01715 [Planomonospora sp. ID67723]|uniref:hypothetical protein n=1 Tax=Planomonospora sp. ID67723 TaxID=2738134 RepID=UPI0018C39C02|nr:hypothetical protein [Planomonospora sp. ID67723]MBG0826501.1 hypothetical protein [Planomonospora sp. ID67723]